MPQPHTQLTAFPVSGLAKLIFVARFALSGTAVETELDEETPLILFTKLNTTKRFHSISCMFIM
jgi:hypothetical protein